MKVKCQARVDILFSDDKTSPTFLGFPRLESIHRSCSNMIMTAAVANHKRRSQPNNQGATSYSGRGRSQLDAFNLGETVYFTSNIPETRLKGMLEVK